MKDNNIVYFSMALNLEREQDRLVNNILAPLGRNNKTDYVKMAVLAYATGQSIQDAIREALAGVTIPAPEPKAANPSPSKPAFNAPTIPAAEPPSQQSEESDIDLSDDLDFLAALREDS